MLNFALVFIASALVIILFHPKVRDAVLWRATVTPLASIIGSGFLIAGPLLTQVAGTWAIFAMFTILLLSYAIGAVIRFNIAHAEPLIEQERPPLTLLRLDECSDLLLGLAYVVSIAFYIRLLASFVLHYGELNDILYQNLLTTFVLLFIALTAWVKGLGGLEKMEEAAVAIKLSIVAALLFALFIFDLNWLSHEESLPFVVHNFSLIERIQLLAGMLLIVQGFETSRYLTEAYDAPTRISSMKLAQLIAGIIYLFFIVLGLPLFLQYQGEANETAIISLGSKVATVLPAMLILAAAMSQFSAAIADTVGAGGLIHELSRNRISTQTAYIALLGIAIVLVWTSNIFEIVTLASRAFAAYYALQCLVAIFTSMQSSTSTNHFRNIGLTALASVLFLIAAFAKPIA